MALPEIVLPSGFPCWLADGHEAELDPVYANVPMRTGHDRTRRVYTTAHEIRTVALFLSESQAQQFHEWFENDLQAGLIQFAAEVQKRGEGQEWWTARFLEPYEAEPQAGPSGPTWRIRARLLLTGTPSDASPIATSMEAEVSVALQSAADLTTQILLAAEISVPLLAAQSDMAIEAEVDVPLLGFVDDPGVAAEIVVALEGAA